MEFTPTERVEEEFTPTEKVESNWKQTASDLYRPTLQTAGAGVGGVLGTPAGPAGMVTGGIIGYGIGDKIADIADQATGFKKARTLKAEMLDSGEDLYEGAKGEALGLGMFHGGKSAFNAVKTASGWGFKKSGLSALKQKVGNYVAGRGGVSPSGQRSEASKQIVASTSYGDIYAKNIDEAKELEKQIPGLKFSMGQQSGDPGLIGLEKKVVGRAKGGGALNDEQVASNNAAVREYYKNAFPEKEGVDDLMSAINDRHVTLKKSNAKLNDALSNTLNKASGDSPEILSARLFNKLKTQEEITKNKVKALYDNVPDVEVQSSRLMESLDEVRKGFDGDIEKASDYPGKLIKGLKKKIVEKSEYGGFTYKDIGFQDLRKTRTIVMNQIRTLEQTGRNNSLLGRLKTIQGGIEDTINQMEGVEGEAGEAFRKASRFYKDEYIGVFKSGAVGDILKSQGKQQASTVEIAGKFFDTKNPQYALQLQKATGDKEGAIEAMREYAIYDLSTKVADPVSGKLTMKGLTKWTNKNKLLLRKYGLEKDFDDIRDLQKMVDVSDDIIGEFESSAAAKLLGGVDPNKAISVLFSGKHGINTAGTAKKILDITKNNKAARNGFKKVFADHIMESVESTAKDMAGKHTIRPAAFSKIVEKYRPALRVLYKDEPEKLIALENVRNAVETVSRNTGPASSGIESEHFASVLAQMAGPAVTKRYAAMIAIRKAGRIFANYSDKQVEKYLLRSVFDPSYAQTLSNGIKGDIPESVLANKIKGQMTAIRQATWGAIGTGVGSKDEE